MKKILPILFLLIFLLSYCIIDKTPINQFEYCHEEDYKIYSIILDSLYKNPASILVLSDSTTTGFVQRNYSYLIEHMPTLKTETYYHYQEINTRPLKLQPVQNIIATCYLISADEKYEYRTLYPEANVLIQFSRIGYNIRRNQALLLFEDYYGPLAGAGFLILFEKNDDWIIKKILGIWIS